MSNKFWVNGSGNWNDINHWSTSSGGPSGIETLGVETVVNGTFATDTVWIKGAGCVISGGTLFQNTNNTLQTGVFTIGKAYKISFDILSITGTGQVSDTYGTTYMYFSSIGTYTSVVVYGVGASIPYYYPKTADLYIVSYDGSFVMDNISIKEILSIPTLTDDVFFDNLSFTGTSTVTVNALANTLSMTWSGITQNVTLTNSAYNLNVYGNLFLCTGLTTNFTSTGYLYLKATDSRTITSNGVIINVNRLYFDGVGGTWTNQDNWSVYNYNNFYCINGTWNTNNKSISCSTSTLYSSAGSFTLNFGSSNVSLMGFDPSTQITLNAGTSTLNLSLFIRGGNYTFYDVIFSGGTGSYWTSSDDFFHNLKIFGSGFQISTNIYVTGILTLSGANSTTQRLLITSNTIGTVRTITASNIVASNVDFRDISVPLNLASNWNLSGITGGSGDCGGNLNITFTSGQTQYFKHTSGSVNWSNSSKWVTSSGGVIQGRVPLPQDYAIFDDNSFTGTTTLTIDCSSFGNLDMSGVDQSVNVVLGTNISVYGHFILGSTISLNNLSYNVVFSGRNGTFNLNSYGIFIRFFYISSFNGIYKNQSTLYVGSDLIILIGTFDFNDYDASSLSLVVSAGATTYMGNGTITINNSGESGYGSVSIASTSNFYAEQSTIKLTPSASISTLGFSGGEKLYNNILFSGTHTGYYDIAGSNTFNELKIDAGRKVRFTAASTTTVGSLIAEGTSTSGITITSITTGSTFTLVKSGTGTVTTNYCNISYSTATSSFRARNSIDGGNNTGWVFSTNNNRYWVGGTGNWDDGLHWSSTSGGAGADLLSLELITNAADRDFTSITGNWVLNGFWSIGGGLLSHSGVESMPAFINVLITGKCYKITVVVSSYTSGVLFIGDGANVGNNLNLTGTGIYTISRLALHPFLGVWSVGEFTGSIDSISVKEVLSYPTLLSDTYFDANSFSTGSTVTINSNANCFDMNWSGITQNVTLLNSTTYNLNVYGSLTLYTGLTLNFSSTGYLYLNATDPQYIITNGVNMNNVSAIYFNGVGSWTNLDDWTFSQVFWIAGTWITNNKTITTSSINTTLSGIRVWNLGSSSVYTSWLNSNGAAITINAGTSTIYMNGGWFRAGSNNILNNVIISRSGAITIADGTFTNLTLTNGYNTVLTLVDNFSILNNLILSGNSTRILITSNTLGTQKKITANNVIASNIDFRDIYLSGSTIFDLSNITGGSGDCGGNSGITFTSSQTQYFKHTSGVANWSNNIKWFSDYLPRITLGRVPLPQDDAIFDVNSFSGTSTLTVDVSRIGKNINMSDVTQFVTFALANDINCYGSFTLGDNIIPSGNYSIYLMGRGNYNLNTFNKSLYNITIDTTGTYTLLSNALISYIYHYNGSFDANDYNLTLFFYYHVSGTGSLYMGNGLWTISNNSNPGFSASAGIITVYAEGSTLKFIASVGSGIVTFYNGNNNYNKVWFSGSHSGSYDVLGNTSTISELVIDTGRNVRFIAGTTNTIKKLTVNGTSASGVTITSTASGSTHNLILTTGGTANVNFANISYSSISPSVYARNSINGGGNSGWAFSSPRYWIGGTGNWNDLTHWSATSGGLSGDTYGQELVVDSGFDNPPNWVLGSGMAISSSLLNINSTNGIYSYQTSVAFNLTTYKITYTISNRISGGVRIGVQNIGMGTARTSDGTYTEYITRTGGGNELFITAAGSTQLSVDNISVKEVYSIPTSINDVIFDQNSFSGTSTVTINTGATCATMDWTGINQNVTLTNTSQALNIYGSLILYTGLTWNFSSTGYLYFKSIMGGNFITTNGVLLNTNKLYFDGLGGTWTNLDDFNLGSSYIGLTNGTWNTNDKNITTTGLFDILTGTKTLTLGSSTFKVGHFNDYLPSTTSGLTFNCGTSTVWINKTTTFYGSWFNSNSSIFYNLIAQGIDLRLAGDQPKNSINLQVLNTLTLSGTSTTRLLVWTYVSGAGGYSLQQTITANSVNCSYVDFININASGNANWNLSGITGFSGDGGGNSGIIFTPSQNLYFSHTSGNANWNDNTKWYLSDRITQSRIPLIQDNVFFDSQSFTGTSTITVPTHLDGYLLCDNFIASGLTQSVTINLPSSGGMIGGDFILDTLLSFNFNSLSLISSGTMIINTFNKSINLTCSSISNTGIFNFMNNFTGSITLGSGTINTNNYTFNFNAGSGLYIINNSTTFNAGNSTLNFINSSFNINYNGIFNCGNSTINFSGLTSNISFVQTNVYASILRFNIVNIYTTGSYYFSINKAATFNKLNIINGTVKFSGVTYSLGSLTTVNTGVTITSMTAEKHTLIKTGTGVVDVSYANISNSIVSGTTLIARNSTDGGGNTNWIFPAKRYWIGGTGNWNDPTHWSNSSGGLSGVTSFGTNLIANGSFDNSEYWGLYSNFNISGGTLNCNTNIQNYAYQTINSITGRTYFLTFSITSYTSGSISSQIGTDLFGIYSGLGTYTGYTTTSTWNTLYFSTAAFVGSIDNVSVREVVSIPTESSDVIFDQNSFSGTSVVTINTVATCLTMDWTGINQSVTFLNTLYTLNLYGSLILSTGLTWTFNNIGHISVKTSSSMFIDTKGVIMEVSANGKGLYFDGTGTYELKNTLILGGNPAINVNSGTFNSNSYDISCNQLGFFGTSIINMGSSTFSTVIYYCAPTVSFNCGTSTFSNKTIYNTYGLSGGNKVYYNIIHFGQSTGYIDSILSCNNFTFNTNSLSLNMNLGSDIIVNGTLTLIGLNSTTNRAYINSTTLGVQRKITANNVIASNVDFRDIYLSGATIWNLSGITGGSGDAGGNSGVTFTPSQTQYWYQGSGSWSNSSKWFTQTNGVGIGRVPLEQDLAIFDENSFSGTSTLTVDIPRIGGLNMSGVTQSVTWSLTNTISCYGDYVLGNNIIPTGSQWIEFIGRGSFNFHPYGKSLTQLRFRFGNYVVLSNIISNYLIIQGGTFNFNNFDTFCPGIDWENADGQVPNIYLGNGTITCSAISGQIVYTYPINLYAQGSTIKLIPASGSANLKFNGNGMVYNNVWFSGTHTGTFDITGSNTFNNITIDAGKTVRFTEGTTTTINNLIAEGTATSGITITSITSGLTHTLVKTGTGAINVKYATISYSNASTPNVFRTRRSTNLIGNTGWVFPPEKYWIGGSGDWHDLNHWSDTSGGSGITASLGPELCLNSGFTTTATWFTSANVSINTGTTMCSFLNASDALSNGVYQSCLTVGKSYKCTLEIKNYVTGGVKVTDSTNEYGTTFTGNGVYSLIYSPISTNVYIMARGGITTLDLDYISVKEVTNFVNSGTTVYFDQNSFTGTSTITENSHLYCLDMDWSEINRNVTFTNVHNLSVYGSLNLYTGLTWNFANPANYLYFKGTQTGNFIKTNGVPFGGSSHSGPYIRFDGVGGSWCNLDGMIQNISGDLNITNGIWNTNSNNITIASYIYGSSSAGLNLGSSTFYAGNGFEFTAGFLVSGGTSTIICSGDWGRAAGQTLYNVIINQAAQNFGGYYGGFICKNLTRIGGNSTLNAMPINSDIIVTDTFTINGYNAAIRTIIYSYTLGTQRKITATNVVASNVDFRDIYLSGSTIWNLSGITGGSGDAGGNSGITFTPNQTQYWHVGTGSWSNASKWFTSTNGVGTGRVPLPQDDIIFDENSFDSGGTITIDVWRIGRSLNMSGVTKSINLLNTLNYQVYGSYILGNNITLTGSYQTWLMGRGLFDFNMYNRGVIFLFFQAFGGIYTNQSSFTSGGDNVWFSSGTFDFNDFDCTLYNFISATSDSSVIVKFGNGTITFFRSSASALFQSFSANQLFFENSTFKFIPTGSANLVLTIGDEKFNKVWLSGTHTGTFDILGNNSFNELKIDAGRKVRFTAGTSQTISRLISLGKPNNLISLTSTLTGTTYTLNGLPNDWLVDYSIIQDSITVPNKHAGVNSVNSGNTIGWNLNELTQNFNLWVLYNVIVLTGFTSPYNTNDAIKISVSNITYNGKSISLGIYVNINSTYTISVYAKSAEYTKLSITDGYGGAYSATFDLISGSVISMLSGIRSGVENIGNGWFRCFITSVPSNVNLYTSITGYPDTGATTGSYDTKYSGTTGSGVYIYGPQLVNGYESLPYFGTSSKIRYWVGDSGNYNDTSHWSLQSNGVTGATIPTISNSSIFDRYSFIKSGQTVTLSGSTDVSSLHIEDITQSGLTITSTDLNIYASLYLSTGMTFNSTNLYFKSSYYENAIYTKDVILNNVYFDNPSGVWKNYDNMTVIGNIHHVNGVWNTSDKKIIMNNYLLDTGTTKQLILGNSTLNVNDFNISNNATNYIITSNTSKIVSSGLTMLSQTLYDVETNNFYGISPTLHNLKISGTTWLVAGSPTITGILQIYGYNSTINRFLLSSDIFKTQRTINATNVLFSNVDIIDIKGNEWNLLDTNTGDGGGNTNIIFPPSTSQYWTGDSGSWSDISKWTSRVPLLQDTAIFDENSFTGISNLNIDMPRISNINLSGITQLVTINDMNVYGDIFLNNYTSVNNLYLYGRNNYLNLYTNTNIFIYGNYTNLSYLKSNSLILSGGSFNLDNTILEVNNWNIQSGLLSAGTSTIKFNSSGITNFTFNGGNNKYNNLWLSGTHTGYYDILGNNIFNEIKIDAGRKIRFQSNSTQIMNSLNIMSTQSNYVTITSTINLPHNLFIIDNRSFIGFEYLDISYSNLLPLTKFYATDSINSGNNTGWIFGILPEYVWVQNNMGILVDNLGKFLF